MKGGTARPRQEVDELAAAPVEFAATFTHVAFGASWLGSNLFHEFVLLPALRAARTSDDLKGVHQTLSRARALDLPVSLGTLLSGLALLVVRYGTLDPLELWAEPPTRLLVIALAIVAALLLLGYFVSGPAGRRVLTASPGGAHTEPLTLDTPGAIKLLSRLAALETAGLLAVLALMVASANGGF